MPTKKFIIDNLWLIAPLIVWSLYWKGMALWNAARRNDIRWFVAILLINTLGILELLYLFVFSKRKPEHS